MEMFLRFGNFIVLALIVLLVIIAIHDLDLISGKSYEASEFGIEILESENDEDRDGIDDYTDILNGAQAFIDNKPKYKNKYYEFGYPTDEYVNSTDILWYALDNAGFDFKELIDEDIANNPSDYNIKEIDSNIDFRRVKNIKVYLDKYVESETLTVEEIEKWQAGDIVLYDNHLAIISDKRNKEGIPFIIHVDQDMKYEENALEERKIIGHYRFSFKEV